jgi:hypothetical protein
LQRSYCVHGIGAFGNDMNSWLGCKQSPQFVSRQRFVVGDDRADFMNNHVTVCL